MGWDHAKLDAALARIDAATTKVSVTRPVGYTITAVGPGRKETLQESGTLTTGPDGRPIKRADADEYYARASKKGGSALGNYGPHPDRETAAREAWQKHPTARQVSTSRGPHGMDIRWHDK